MVFGEGIDEYVKGEKVVKGSQEVSESTTEEREEVTALQ
jgi:hypothetical protein